MQVEGISNSDIFWATTIRWSKEQNAAYIGSNQGTVRKLVGDQLETLAYSELHISGFHQIEGQVIVQTPSRPVCLLNEGELIPVEAEQGSVFSNVDKGRVAIWNRQTKEIRVETLAGKVERTQKQEERPREIRLDGDELTALEDPRYWARFTPSGVIKTAYDPKTREQKIVDENKKGVFLGVTDDYTVLKDGLYDKDWSRVVDFEKPPVAWATSGSRVAWAYVSKTEERWGQTVEAAWTVVVRNIEEKKEQSVELSTAVGAMAFCDERLLVGGANLTWIIPQNASQ